MIDSVFPISSNIPGHPDTPGLTKRELFAAMILQGLCAANLIPSAVSDEERFMSVAQVRARLAVYEAEALIDELNKYGR